MHSQAALQSLLHILDHTIHHNAHAQAQPPGLVLALQRLLELLHARLLRAHAADCTFVSRALSSPRLAVQLLRTPVARLPTSLSLQNATVWLPRALRARLEAQVPGGLVDVVLQVAPGAPPLVTDLVTLHFYDTATARAVAVEGLPEPATLAVPLSGDALRYAPVTDWYRCVYETPGNGNAEPGSESGGDSATHATLSGVADSWASDPTGWASDGVWLVAEVGARLVCQTTHLSTFAVTPVPRVTAVGGCPLDVAPAALHCPRPGPDSRLVVLGRNFGAAGATLAITAPSGGTWECGALAHGPETGADEELQCTGLVPAAALGPSVPGDAAAWAAVTVTTAFGQVHRLTRALLFAEVPRLSGFAASNCRSVDARTLVDCPLEGARFTVMGAGLRGYGATAIWAGGLRCPDVRATNGTHAECLGVAAGAGGGYGLEVRVWVAGVAAAAGLTVSFVDPCSVKPGVWAGPDCDVCQAGHWGPSCDARCPGLVPGAAGALPAVCSGHGACDDGLDGLGLCACDRGTPGHWGGANCSECAEGYYGVGCTSQCPGEWPANAPPQVCLNRGTCDSGVGGAGVCDCLLGYAGPACELRCPVAGGALCNAHGACAPTAHSGLGACNCTADAVAGVWAGPACTVCAPGWMGPGCRVMCPGLAGAGAEGVPCSGHGTCALVAAVDAAECACNSGWVGVACANSCPASRGVVCAGHGACALSGNGSAVCECTAALVEGYWGGAACGTCAFGWYGPDCLQPCARDNATGAVCGGHGACLTTGECMCDAPYCGPACGVQDCVVCSPGTYGPGCAGICDCAPNGTCFDGVDGSGACACDAGWAGPRCGIRCAGPPDDPCGGHGQCNAVDGACECDLGWRHGLDGACAIPCPGGAANPCTGHGVCDSAAVCACDAGYGGLDCARACPVDAALGLCSGHGACSAADGTCACARDTEQGYWTGAACAVCAPARFGANCTELCVHGTTVQQDCVCSPGYFGVGCAGQCPGPAGNPCSSHGACDDGSDGTGLCGCDFGYAGADCALTCAGGVTAPCSGHGTCLPDATCACHDSKTGHYAGPLCAECRAPYFGSDCALRCPQSGGRPCNGHGKCTTHAKCTCASTAASGFWAGRACEDCQTGYWGPDCRAECPGGACSPCSGHGACFDGWSGNGTCACTVTAAGGRFIGNACQECAPGHWGTDCADECPGGATTPCSGHGRCSTGRDGSGSCTCDSGPSGGYWAGPACGDCQPGFYGVQCVGECPGVTAGAACSGHGTCRDGTAGDGRCACAPGYVGSACDAACPLVQGHVCNRRGACVRESGGVAGCVCNADNGTGHWAGAACGVCAAGYFGPECKGECAGGAAQPCSLHGVCAEGLAGDGACACAEGWAGFACDVQCPGLGSAGPCTGHGRCVPVTGVCACNAGNRTGYWAGAVCADCALGWSGPGCDMPCPVGPQGDVCAAAGTCSAGVCVCADGRCGDVCELSGPECDPARCPDGYSGDACDRPCPGINSSGAGTICSGHGTCASTRTGTGECACDEGWSGPSCATPCPGAPACHGHGTCDARAPGCQCVGGYAGAECAIACAGGVLQPCAGHGTCSAGQTGDGSCACDPGYFGAACAEECPGGAATPCAGHGQCSVLNGTCACAARWEGAACDACAPGWWSEACDHRCGNGVSVGRRCLCQSGWYGPACDAQCPGGWRRPCSGHGACDDGDAGNGTCACDPGWLSGVCDVPCPGVEATGWPCAGHGQCVDRETCVCDAGAVRGHWAGPACAVCADGWVGAGCDRTCPRPAGVLCGGHGVCSPATERCQCVATPQQGHWDESSNCTECLPAYHGPNCAQECPGGPCSPCSGHGMCSDGRSGSGLCACDAQWQGWACQECAFGWYSQVLLRPARHLVDEISGGALHTTS